MCPVHPEDVDIPFILRMPMCPVRPEEAYAVRRLEGPEATIQLYFEPLFIYSTLKKNTAILQNRGEWQ